MKSGNNSIEPSSFRDPSGTVYVHNGVLLRQINSCYEKQYRHMMDSRLYAELTEKGLLVRHEEKANAGITDGAYLVIQPERIPFISYPYEWSFGMLKDAALLTLRCHRLALDKGMILKDASAYNVQFFHGHPVLIDTLSFDFYQEGMPWVAYGQFCRHFVAPLLLMCNVDLRLNKLLRLYIDGVPLDLASKLLKGRGGFFAKQHIHWHAKATQRHAEDGKRAGAVKGISISKSNHIAMIDSLIRNIEALGLRNEKTEWADYYANTNYSKTASDAKALIVKEYVEAISAAHVWDLGANDGTYSRLALNSTADVVAFDIDALAVERNYSCVKSENLNMLPLVMDFSNPSPSIGFANEERMCMAQRQKADCVMALAIIHHLAISNNLPLERIAQWLSTLAPHLIIEFVPKEDSQVQILLATRQDIFPDYSQDGFEGAFQKEYTILDKKQIKGSMRVLYHMRSSVFSKD